MSEDASDLVRLHAFGAVLALMVMNPEGTRRHLAAVEARVDRAMRDYHHLRLAGGFRRLCEVKEKAEERQWPRYL